MTVTSIGGAVRAVIIASGALPEVGQDIYRDVAPNAASPPYITFTEPISDTPFLTGDSLTLYRRSHIQVTLYQTATAEVFAMKDALVLALDDCQLLNVNKQVMRCRVVDSRRIFDSEYQEVRSVITLRVTHSN